MTSSFLLALPIMYLVRQALLAHLEALVATGRRQSTALHAERSEARLTLHYSINSNRIDKSVATFLSPQ